jgi:multimeric flavodoxin WrbA
MKTTNQHGSSLLRYGILETVLIIVVALVYWGEPAHAFLSSLHSAVSPNHNNHHRLFDLTAVRNTHTIRVALMMATPGQSEAQKRQKREEEIRTKLAQLKSAGKMNKGGDGSEGMMKEAEAFFNKESPLRKFERRQQALKEEEEAEALLKAQQEEECEGTMDDNVA